MLSCPWRLCQVRPLRGTATQAQQICYGSWMEHMPGNESAASTFSDMNAGTASDHFNIGTSHLRQAAQLALFGPARPAEAADVTLSGPVQSGPSAYPSSAVSPMVDSDEEDENGMARPGRTYSVFLPVDPWKETWDLVVLMFILYSAVMVPYRICFSADATGWIFVYEQVVTLVFLTDVIFNFNTAYLDEEKWVLDRGLIAQRYVSGWFWIDAPSSVPVEMIDLLSKGDSSSLGILRFLRLFRLLRLLKLLKARASGPQHHSCPLGNSCLPADRLPARSQLGDYVAALEIKHDLNLTFLRICTMVANMMFLAHMLGCFWFYTAAMIGINEDTTTWVSTYNDGSAMYADPSVQYLYAVYWALTTLTTVRAQLYLAATLS